MVPISRAHTPPLSRRLGLPLPLPKQKKIKNIRNVHQVKNNSVGTSATSPNKNTPLPRPADTPSHPRRPTPHPP